MIDAQCRSALADIVGAAGYRDADRLADLAPGFHPDNLKAGLAVAPASTAQVSAVLELCHRHRIPVVPQAGRTGLAGGAASAPGDLIVQLDRMNAVADVDPAAMIVTAEAGATLQSVQDAAAQCGLAPGIDLAARGTATVGGMVATNAGGNEAFRNGVMRHRIVGLEAVLADGTVLNDLKCVTKANEGYDLKQLFIGSEGTLGIVTRVVLRLEAAPGACETALVACPDAAAAVSLLTRLRSSATFGLRAAEVMWRDYALISATELGLDALARFLAEAPVSVIFEIDGAGAARDALMHEIQAAAEEGALLDALIASSGRERDDIWKVREDSWTIERVWPHGLWYDVSVPLGKLDTYVNRLRDAVTDIDKALTVFAFGHLGDGNLHLTISSGSEIDGLYEQVGDVVYRDLDDWGGSFSAEHGIGLEKRAALERILPPEHRALMTSIKQAFDPHGIMNPGKLLSP